MCGCADVCLLLLQDEMAKLAESEGTSTSGLGKINNVLMQMRKNCNHPDLITSAFTADLDYPAPEVLCEQSGKLALLNRLLKKLHQKGHKVLIFSQVSGIICGGGMSAGVILGACAFHACFDFKVLLEYRILCQCQPAPSPATPFRPLVHQA